MKAARETLIPLAFDEDDDCAPLRYTLRTQARIATLRRLTKAAMTLICSVLEDPLLLHTLELALFEACSNVVLHAYKAAEQGELQILVALSPKRHITFEITDWGAGFASYPVIVYSPPPQKEYGRGLLIIHGLADHFSICKKGDATVLRMRFIIEESKWRTCEFQKEGPGWL